MEKTAIVLGGSGLTGSLLLNLLLNDNRYAQVKVFGRRTMGMGHPKLKEYLCNLLDLKDESKNFTADEVFCCIGTTAAKTPDKTEYRNIDYGIPVTAASLCKTNGINTFLVISAMGANPKSRVFYNRTKGDMEAAVLEQGIRKTHILQPSLIEGHREESRPGEWFFKQVFKVLNVLLMGPLKKYRSIHPKKIARAMVWLANNTYEEVKIESDKIEGLANKPH